MSPTPTSPASVVLEKKTIMVPAAKMEEEEDVDDDFGHYDSSSEEEEESGEEESSEDDEEDSGSDEDSSSDEEEEAALEAAEAFLKGIQTQKYRRVVSANNLSDLLKMTSGSAMTSGSIQHFGPTVMVDSTPTQPAKSATQGAFAMCLEEKKKQRRANRRRHSNKGGLTNSQDTTMQDDGSQKSNSSMASSQSMTNLAAFAAAQEEKIMRTNSNSSSSSQDRKNMRRSVSSGTVLQTMSAQMSSLSENDGAINPVDYLTQLLGAKPETFAYDSPLLEGFFLGVKPEYVQAWNSDLTHIVRSHDLSALRQLHQQGQRLQACNAFGESIVHLCIRRGTPAMLRFLMQDAGVSVRVCCDYGRTPLHDAAWTLKGEESGKLEMMTLLVQECPMQLLITDKRGFTPLHYVPRNQWQAADDFLDVQAKAGRLPQTKTTRESFKLE